MEALAVATQLEETRFLADHDPLTRLLNRRALLSELAATTDSEAGAPLALVFLDVDNFKEINDGQGHATAFSHPNGARLKRLPQTWSQTSHESNSTTHSSICASVTHCGRSTIDANIRASCIAVLHNASASSWSFPTCFASDRTNGIDNPSVPSLLIPNRAIPATFVGLALALIVSIISSITSVIVCRTVYVN